MNDMLSKSLFFVQPTVLVRDAAATGVAAIVGKKNSTSTPSACRKHVIRAQLGFATVSRRQFFSGKALSFKAECPVEENSVTSATLTPPRPTVREPSDKDWSTVDLATVGFDIDILKRPDGALNFRPLMPPVGAVLERHCDEKRVLLSWEEVERLADMLVDQIRESLDGQPVRRVYDVMVAITRGGMIPGCLLSEALNFRNVETACVMFYTGQGAGQTLSKPVIMHFPTDSSFQGQRVLLVDDVWDSGSTAVAVRDRLLRAGASKVTVACLNFKPSENKYPGQQPDFYAATIEDDSWITYPWQRDC